MSDGNQAAYAVVAAAFVTGFWAWITQRAKTSEDDHKEDTQSKVSESQTIVQGYKEFNEQLQGRITILTNEVSNLWVNFHGLQDSLRESEKLRIDALRQVFELESQVKDLRARVDACESQKTALERDNDRLTRILLNRNVDPRGMN